MSWFTKKETKGIPEHIYDFVTDRISGLKSKVDDLSHRIKLLETPAKFKIGDHVQVKDKDGKIFTTGIVTDVYPDTRYNKVTWEYTLLSGSEKIRTEEYYLHFDMS